MGVVDFPGTDVLRSVVKQSLTTDPLGERHGWHQFRARGRDGSWMVTGALVDDRLPVVLGVVRAGLGEYLNLRAARAMRMEEDLRTAVLADDGTAEVLMVRGVPFETDEVHAMLGVLVAVNQAAMEREIGEAAL